MRWVQERKNIRSTLKLIKLGEKASEQLYKYIRLVRGRGMKEIIESSFVLELGVSPSHSNDWQLFSYSVCPLLSMKSINFFPICPDFQFTTHSSSQTFNYRSHPQNVQIQKGQPISCRQILLQLIENQQSALQHSDTPCHLIQETQACLRHLITKGQQKMSLLLLLHSNLTSHTVIASRSSKLKHLSNTYYEDFLW